MNKSKYLDFLECDYDSYVQYMLQASDTTRLIVDINDLRRKDQTLTHDLLNKSIEELLIFEDALNEFVHSKSTIAKRRKVKYYIGLMGSLGNARHLTPRQLKADLLGKMVCVEGIVTSVSKVQVKLERIVQYCAAKKTYTSRCPINGFLAQRDIDGIYIFLLNIYENAIIESIIIF